MTMVSPEEETTSMANPVVIAMTMTRPVLTGSSLSR